MLLTLHILGTLIARKCPEIYKSNFHYMVTESHL